MQETPSTVGTPPQQLLDELLTRFETGLRSDGPPRLEDVVRSVPETYRPDVFRYLLPVELEHHIRVQRPLDLNEARDRFGPLGPWTAPILGEFLGHTISWTASGAGSPAPGPAPAAVSIGQYELLSELGSGGFGKVFKARHSQLKRLVALKVLIPHRALAPGGVERFLREMEVLGRLNHPHIAQASDAGECDGYYFLAMEYVEGVDLGHLLKTVTRLHVPDACALARQAAAALVFIDGRGTVHRDLKPSNLLLGRDGVVRVLDLGLAKLRDLPPWEHLTETGAVMGTPEYMSPEQTRESRDVTVRSDVYSLGCTLYALLAGAPPFTRGESVYDLLRAHNESPPPALGAVRGDVPPELERLIGRMLEKPPAQRPAPDEVARALEPFCEGADLKRLVAECGARQELPVHLPTAHTRLVFAPAPTGTLAAPQPPTRSVSAPAQRAVRWRKRLVIGAPVLAIVLGGGVWTVVPRPWEPGDGTAVAPNPPAPPAAPEPPPRTFKVDEWTELLDRPPVKRIWPENDPRSHFQYDPANRQLSLNCVDFGALELGHVGAAAFDMDAVIFQNGWNSGRVGISFRGRLAPAAPPAFSWQGDVLYLRSLGVPPERATLARGELKRHAATGAAMVIPWRVYDVPPPRGGDHRLSCTVTPGGVTEVRWNGELAVPPKTSPPDPHEPAEGGVGIVVHDSHALFRSVRVRVHKPSGDRP
ncbi:serine/threonine protein kinase [Frigoriglobus tundricola]|uniref:Serine/threonine protein kinase n=1 Tax=Frigoriglobus tundricola TaxID=2774151 RepID=A0A6M5Z3Q9_9BACT|nr:serine/threonine-protein kinase [Frigoriglobus tundricola]QJX00104.1 Serine/threonine protein kinase [Frigoriglobus tundricola]